MLLSNYEGIPDKVVTIQEGITTEIVGSGIELSSALGCKTISCPDKSGFDDAKDAAKGADYVILVLGLQGSLEGEGHDRAPTKCEGIEQDVLALPGCQGALVDSILTVNSKVILVLLNGGPLSIPDQLKNDGVLAIIEAFYPGALGGTAVASVLFGKYNPAGRMPITTVTSSKELPIATNYNMSDTPGRTYRYYSNKPLIPFGFGLSYTLFEYSNMVLPTSTISQCDYLKISATIKNTGGMSGDEVIQVYIIPESLPHSEPLFPKIQLVSFERINIPKGDSHTTTFEINPYLLSLVAEDGVNYIFPGNYKISVGGCLPVDSMVEECLSLRVLLSNYEGIPDKVVTIQEGITTEIVGSGIELSSALGCKTISCPDKSGFDDAKDAAKGADYVILVLGLQGSLEGEGHDRAPTKCEGIEQDVLALPGCQGALVDSILTVNSKVILVLLNGGPLSIPDQLKNDGVLAIIEAFYPGALGGTAVASVLFGKYNPAGRMPITTVTSSKELPIATNYNMSDTPGRTYRYYSNKPLIPFGFGLSYTLFEYSNMVLPTSTISQCDYLKISATIKNTGGMSGDEVIQVYIIPESLPHSEPLFPKIQLVSFERINIPKGDSHTTTFEINPYLLSLVAEDGVNYIFPGNYKISVGGCLPVDSMVEECLSLRVLLSNYEGIPDKVVYHSRRYYN